MSNIRYFKVGGYVRDFVMGNRDFSDVDYVVTGVSEENFLKSKPFGRTFKKIHSQSFPVFHDQDGNEWALARLERKSGKGYSGFSVETSEDLTIEDDLRRRDLTINAMAIEIYDDMKTRILYVIDPFGGKSDIENKILRHVSDAFSEDPVRVLRLARFRANFGPDWKIADETRDLVKHMGKSGELSHLTPERIWKEMSRALMTRYPRLFFDTLLECDVLHIVFPEIYRLKTALESRKWHPEGDAYEHTMLVLQQAAEIAPAKYSLEIRFACLTHDMGKALTPFDKLPAHHGHDVAGVTVVRDFSNRLTVPSKIRDSAMISCRYHMYGHSLNKLNSKTIVRLFDRIYDKNDETDVYVLYWVFMCDHRGRLGSENSDVSHIGIFLSFLAAYKSVKFIDVFPDFAKNLDPEKIKQKMFDTRRKVVEDVRKLYTIKA